MPRIRLVGASLSEPHIDRTSGRFSIYHHYYHHVRPSPARRVRPHEDHARSRQEVAHVHVRPHACICQLHCQQLLYLSTVCDSCCVFRQSATVAVSFDIGSLQYGFYKSSTRLRYKSATRLRSANPGITDERDSFNEGGSERGTAVTQRQRYKGRNGWVNEEWGTELGALLTLSNEGNQFCSIDVTDWPPSQLKRDRPGYNRWGTDWPPNQLRRERPGCSRWALASVNDWPPSQLKRERPGCSWWGTDWHGQHAYSGHVINCLLVYNHCWSAKLAP